MNQVFEESSIAGINLKNRIIRSATHEGLGFEGRPIEELTDLYVKLAKGGVGAIVTGYVGIQHKGKTFVNMRMFDNDRYIQDYLKLNTELKQYGTPIILQIAHGGGNSNKKITGQDVFAPSRKVYPLHFSYAKELSELQIREIVEGFINAIVRAKRAGFDGVQLHAAHGYLLSEFLSPYMNTRKDAWGGRLENRFRIINEIMYGAREKVGNYPILVKYSAYDYDKKGLKVEDGIKIAEMFQKAGLDAIEVSCGGYFDFYSIVRVEKIPTEAIFKLYPGYNTLPSPIKKLGELILPKVNKTYGPIKNYNVHAAEQIKKLVDIPVIVVGGIRNFADIEKIINEGKADYVSMSRPFIIETDIVNKFKMRKQTESKCIDCGYCLIGSISKPIKCYYGKVNI